MPSLRETLVRTPFGEFSIDRYPTDDPAELRAWDAADELVLAHVGELRQPLSRVVIANDGFGALAVTMAAHGARVTSVCDSYLAQTGAKRAARNNGVSLDDSHFTSTLGLGDLAAEPADLVMIKIPKSLDHLQFQLHALRSHIGASTIVVGAGMTKQIHRSTIELFETAIGPTHTSRAVKKARLVVATPAPRLDSASTNKWPHQRFDETTGLQVANWPGVFSPDRTDRATQLLVANLPSMSPNSVAVDLGCGTGIIGTYVARHNSCQVICVDESLLALRSARATASANDIDEDRLRCIAGNGMCDLAEPRPPTVDWIFTNPPFHGAAAQDRSIATRWFKESRQVLSPRGQLWVVANRHLGYHTAMKRVFGNCDLIASDPAFVVLRSTGR